MSGVTKDMPEPILQVRGLRRFLGEGDARVEVLRGVDLQLTAGRSYAIVGPSGCGKSSLLYLLGLIDQPDAGELHFGGHELANASAQLRTEVRREKIGFIFQFHFLLKEFTALENILLPMRRLGKYSEAEMRERGMQLLKDVGLADKAKRMANQLSGGEQQRVAVARAMAHRPPLLLADEPTGNLDVKNSHQVFEMMRNFARENNQTLLMVTHNPELARCCDIQLTMQDGVFID